MYIWNYIFSNIALTFINSENNTKLMTLYQAIRNIQFICLYKWAWAILVSWGCLGNRMTLHCCRCDNRHYHMNTIRLSFKESIITCYWLQLSAVTIYLQRSISESEHNCLYLSLQLLSQNIAGAAIYIILKCHCSVVWQ